MAHQYSSAPPYGTQQPPVPYYSPFNPSAVQQVGSGPQDFQQTGSFAPNLRPASGLSNNLRYDANASIPHQPVPLPFPPFNPELLKHFPIPPPPIPPNAQFAPAPGTPTVYSQYPPPTIDTPPRPFSQSHYPQFTQQGAPAIEQPPQQQEQRPHIQTQQMREVGIVPDQIRQPVLPHQQLTVDPSTAQPTLNRLQNNVSRGYEAINAHSFATHNSEESAQDTLPGLSSSPQFIDQTSSATGLNLSKTDQASHRAIQSLVDPLPSLELKQRAKAALLSLTPYGIQYEQLLAEGVNASLLQHLYEELGLTWTSSADSPHNAQSLNVSTGEAQAFSALEEVKESAVSHVPSLNSSNAPASKVPSTIAASQIPPTASPNMERKDRIAQLLAAKAGKTAIPGSHSKSQSPASPAESSNTQPGGSTESISTSQPVKTFSHLVQTTTVQQKLEQQRKDGARDIQPQLGSSTGDGNFGRGHPPILDHRISEILSSSATPTPVKEQYASLIPGLFLTSAEQENTAVLKIDDGVPSTQQQASKSPQATTEFSEETATASTNEQLYASQKRRIAEESMEVEYPEAKRQATHSEEMKHASADLGNRQGDNEDDASEGEIVEDEGLEEDDDGRYHPEQPLINHIQTEKDKPSHSSKQTDIETMRKRIAEKQQRQSLKRGQSHLSAPTALITGPTPSQVVAPNLSISLPVTKIPEQITTPAKVDDRVGQNPRPLLKATQEQIAERAAQLKADFLRQRALRQKQLQEGIPALDNEVTKTQRKLQETKARLARLQSDIKGYETSISQAKKDEHQLLNQVESLEKQISEGVSGQKHFSSELHHLKEQNSKEVELQSRSTLDQSSTRMATQSEERVKSSNVSEEVQLQSNSTDHESELSVPARTDKIRGNHVIPEKGPHKKNPLGGIATTAVNGNHLVSGTTETKVASAQDADPKSHTQSSKDIAVQAATDNEELNDDSDEAMEESEDDDDDDESLDSRMSIDDESTDSASMSNSGSEDYEPAEPDPDLSQRSDEKMDSDGYKPHTDHNHQYDGALEEDGDDYEPTDNLDSMDVSEQASIPAVSSLPTPVSGANDVGDPANFDNQQALGDSQPAQTIQEVQHGHQERDRQLSEADALTKTQDMPTGEETDGSLVLGSANPLPVRYVPYQSPLSSFKSYRFNPLFNDQVKTGYRSLTYSHKIDPKTPICLTELSGIQCTDPQCPEQHFGALALTDDKILVQMSSASDIKDKNLRDQYLIGLKQVIARLRQEGVKEFSAVADALSQYRREWTASQTDA